MSLRRLGLIATLAACAGDGGPTVDAIAPARGARGARVIVSGDGFCGDHAVTAAGACASLPSGAVDFGLEFPIVRAPLEAWQAGAITAVVPDQVATGTTTVYVTVDGRTSNGVAFEVLP